MVQLQQGAGFRMIMCEAHNQVMIQQSKKWGFSHNYNFGAWLNGGTGVAKMVSR